MNDLVLKPIENKNISSVKLTDMLVVAKKNIKEIMGLSKEYNNAKKLFPVITKNMAVSRSGVNYVLGDVYSKYEKQFADMVARLVIKSVFDHLMKFGHYETLNGLLSSKYINEQERKLINDNFDKCALNYINKHSGGLMQQKESLYDFNQLVKILSIDYISDETKSKVEETLLKRAKNKKEPFLYDIAANKDIPEYIKTQANVVLEKIKQKGHSKYLKPQLN